MAKVTKISLPVQHMLDFACAPYAVWSTHSSIFFFFFFFSFHPLLQMVNYVFHNLIVQPSYGFECPRINRCEL